MRFLLAPLAVLTILALPTVAHADTVFTINATFNGGAVGDGVTGTITIDTVNGDVTGQDLVYVFQGDTQTFTAAPITQFEFPYAPPFYFVDLMSQGEQISYFNFTVPTLVGYAGGNLCTLANTCGGGASNFFATSGTPNFAAGTVVAATPEPSSLALLGTGILSLAGAARRKLRKA